ncbi:hypothetical protein KBZ12_17735 [Cyanobium sp. Cruz CV13-4-11]|uniref:hypothetical protein n=1 Tax=unclassified Cyanobium TaxID=2627006 RepID=UPI0020CF9B9A|nr:MULTISPECIES: hypothetical protein [unclassified Cyanobium]MCP9921279.1 hypothetical protein [Cyanobium sp. Cruz CV13-4-11]
MSSQLGFGDDPLFPLSGQIGADALQAGAQFTHFILKQAELFARLAQGPVGGFHQDLGGFAQLLFSRSQGNAHFVAGGRRQRLFGQRRVLRFRTWGVVLGRLHPGVYTAINLKWVSQRQWFAAERKTR